MTHGARRGGARRIAATALDVALRAARTPPAARAVGLLERMGRWPSGILAVLTYHRVDDRAARPDLAPSLLSATPDDFDGQMRSLVRRFRPIGAAELLAALDGARLPARAVLVTIDDAYRDAALHAWPIARRHGVPVLLFVSTAIPGATGAPFWWDRLWAALVRADPARRDAAGVSLGMVRGATAAGARDAFDVLREHLKALPDAAMRAALDVVVAALDPDGAPAAAGTHAPPPAPDAMLDWPALRALASDGVTLAPHGRTHAFLDRLDPAALAAELEGARRDLERETGATTPITAYPSGQHDDRVVAATGAAGYRVAFTTRRGTNHLPSADPLRLARINVGGRTDETLIRAQLAPVVVRLRTTATRRRDAGARPAGDQRGETP